jgi:hypothetical protein
MCVSIFSTTFAYNISHSTKNLARYRQKCRNVFMLSTRDSWRIVMQLEFSRQIFGNSADIKFHRNPSSGSAVVKRTGHAEKQVSRYEVTVQYIIHMHEYSFMLKCKLLSNMFQISNLTWPTVNIIHESNNRSAADELSRILQQPKFVTFFTRAHHCFLLTDRYSEPTPFHLDF